MQGAEGVKPGEVSD